MQSFCRLLPLERGDGPHNMAADEVLLEAAGAGTASLRFYTWTVPTLSLGYFQPAALRHKHPQLAQLPFVRRPTGGEAILHHQELTYALALPAAEVWRRGEPWLTRMHRIIVAALRGLGAAARVYAGLPQSPADRQLCFQLVLPGDVVMEGSKIAGSAQRRRKGGLLQHGSVLLAGSRFAPQLPGIRELRGGDLAAPELREAVVQEFRRHTAWDLTLHDWTEGERMRIEQLVLTRYGQDSWNQKR